MCTLLTRLRHWCIELLGGYVQQGRGRIVGQRDGSIKISHMAEISNIDVEIHAFGVCTVRSVYQSGYPTVRAENYFVENYLSSKENHTH